MALYQSIHTGLVIDEAVSKINNINLDIVYLSGVTSGNTQSIIDLSNDIDYVSGITDEAAVRIFRKYFEPLI